ncbi:hypothetical protein CHCC20375_3276 [Bacillus licheniformis]|nr:hypothetical protein CHCC20375_3276 [Bacillus licheniformis]
MQWSFTSETDKLAVSPFIKSRTFILRFISSFLFSFDFLPNLFYHLTFERSPFKVLDIGEKTV